LEAVLAVIFFPTRALSVEWIRFLISFIGQDLQDYWDFFRKESDKKGTKKHISEKNYEEKIRFFKNERAQKSLCKKKEFFLFYLLKRAERSDSHNSSIVNHHSSFHGVSHEP
jgi:hypothetical protein